MARVRYIVFFRAYLIKYLACNNLKSLKCQCSMRGTYLVLVTVSITNDKQINKI